MGMFDDDIEEALGKGLAHGLGHIGGALIGGAIAGAISGSANSNKKNNRDNDDYDEDDEDEPKKIFVSPRGEYKVVKCPGCGHRASIVDGDGVADRCEYCGTAIGN